MSHLSAYLPQDRLRALARGETLPDRTCGTVLFADISGFTPLTERLTQILGARRGVEELTTHLNRAYDALIGVLERYGGSIIGFAGDAITCWFDLIPYAPVREDGWGTESAFRSSACAFALQAAMRAFPDLALKVSLATGPVRRFVVGAPQIQLLDTLAGATLERMAAGELLADKGEVLADGPTVAALGDAASILEWRTAPGTHERFAVVSSLASFHQSRGADHEPQDTDRESQIIDEQLRPWLLPAIYEREQAGMGAFLTELRSAVVLFLRFEGIDYDGDDAAGARLDEFVRRVQESVTRHGGTLLNLTIGDKGSYSYSAFGAPVAHENDARRALNAALELRALAAELPFISGVQIGLSCGVMRTGAYGGATRRTYGILGDEVNLAARLMQAAAPGQIIVSGRVQYAAAGDFAFESIPALQVKGKAQPVMVFLLSTVARRKNYRLLDPVYALPMVGRQAELALIAEKMDLAVQGQGQVVAITAEAGMGKSRLAAEIIHLAQRRGFTGYGGACQSDGVNTAYLVWRAILRGFFDVDADAPAEQQAKCLATALESFAPQRLAVLPLVAGAIGLVLPDNDFTRNLEPKDRKAALEAALVDCVRGAAEVVRLGRSALLFVLEDLHWLDALSHDLLEEVVRASANLPVLILLAYRPSETERLAAPRLEKLDYFTRIELQNLTLAEAALAISAKLAQLFPQRGGDLPEATTRRLMERAQGNPFYLEELLNYLRDRGIDPRHAGAMESLELPDSLHTLVLSRLDQLNEHEKITLKVASIIGRLFRVRWLNGYYPEVGDDEQLKQILERLRKLDITPLDTPEPELAYLFKHLVTQEVTYESLPYATRAGLHEQLARWLEATQPPPVELLAFHYGRSANLGKKREYWLKAGESAQAAFANDAALDYYERLLPLLTAPNEQIDLHLKWGTVLERVGQWDKAATHYREALACVDRMALPSAAPAARCQIALGKLCRLQGDYAAALEWLEQARAGWAAQSDRTGLSQTLIEIGNIYWLKGDYGVARQHLEEGLALARALGDKPGMALALNNLGNAAYLQGDYPAARTLYKKSLALKRETGDKWGIAASLNNLGSVAYLQGDYSAARALLEESQALKREMGDKRGIATALNNLGNIAYYQGDYVAARTLLAEGLALFREIGNKWGITHALIGLGVVALAQAETATARRFITESLRLREALGDKQGMASSLSGLAGVAIGEDAPRRAAQLAGAAEALRASIKAQMEPEVRLVHEGAVAAARAGLSEAEFSAAWAEGEKMPLEEAVAFALEEIHE